MLTAFFAAAMASPPSNTLMLSGFVESVTECVDDDGNPWTHASLRTAGGDLLDLPLPYGPLPDGSTVVGAGHPHLSVGEEVVGKINAWADGRQHLSTSKIRGGGLFKVVRGEGTSFLIDATGAVMMVSERGLTRGVRSPDLAFDRAGFRPVLLNHAAELARDLEQFEYNDWEPPQRVASIIINLDVESEQGDPCAVAVEENSTAWKTCTFHRVGSVSIRASDEGVDGVRVEMDRLVPSVSSDVAEQESQSHQSPVLVGDSSVGGAGRGSLVLEGAGDVALQPSWSRYGFRLRRLDQLRMRSLFARVEDAQIAWAAEGVQDYASGLVDNPTGCGIDGAYDFVPFNSTEEAQ